MRLPCFTLLIFRCQKQKGESLIGLWLVEKVTVGEQSQTPIARWMRFEVNNMQTSGNGWLQHSYGNWNLIDNQLILKDFNGVLDNVGSFDIQLNGDSMIWKRNEEGADVTVLLKKIKKLPQSDWE